MEQCAHAIVYWPGMSTYISNMRDRRAECKRNAPTQATQPRLLPPPHCPLPYLKQCSPNSSPMAVGDHLSGWMKVFGSPAGANLAGAAAFTTSIPSSPHLVHRKHIPVMMPQNLLQVLQRLSFVSGEYEIACPRPTSISPMEEQRWQ